MIKREYQVTIVYMANGEIFQDSITGEAAEAVINQARRGQDIRYSGTNEYGGFTYLIPWDAVVIVNAQSTVKTEAASEDDVCKEYVASGITLASDITSAVAADYDATAKSVTLYYAGGTSQTYDFSSSDNIKPHISSVIYKGEEAKDTATFRFFKTNEVDTNTVCLTFLAEIDGQTLDKEICFPKHS